MLRGGSGLRGAGLAIACLALLGLLALPVAAQEDGAGPPIDDVLPDEQSELPSSGADIPSRTIPTPADGEPEIRSAIVTIDQELLFSNSAWGKRTQARLAREGDRLEAENERLVTQLSNEEAELTEQRGVLDPAEFRRLAEAFDIRATEVRRERVRAVQDVNDWAAADRDAFYRAVLPYMGELMQERGAVAVLDRRTVFVSLDAIDMTQELVEILDEALGDGEGVVPYEPQTSTVPEEAPQQ